MYTPISKAKSAVATIHNYLWNTATASRETTLYFGSTAGAVQFSAEMSGR